jgi:hypothetical protein
MKNCRGGLFTICLWIGSTGFHGLGQTTPGPSFHHLDRIELSTGMNMPADSVVRPLETQYTACLDVADRLLIASIEFGSSAFEVEARALDVEDISREPRSAPYGHVVP